MARNTIAITFPGDRCAAGQGNTRDAMILSLLSSEAMVDSRVYEVLNAEEVEEFKEVRAYLGFQFRRSRLHSDHLCDRIILIRTPQNKLFS
jgi:hypothetical protein